MDHELSVRVVAESHIIHHNVQRVSKHGYKQF